MTVQTKPVPARETLNIRISSDMRALIDRAAEAGGKTRTDFVLEAVRRAAEEALLDKALYMVGPDAHAAFLAALDAPAQPNEQLRRTMRAHTPWSLG